MKFVTPLRTLCLAMLASIALPAGALAQTLIVTDIAVEGEAGFKLTVPTIEATGSNLDEAAIRALFTNAFTDSVEQLATLDATSIVVPEVIVSYTVPTGTGTPTPATVVYRNLTLSDVADGVAGSAALEAIEIGGVPDMTISIGGTSTSMLDLGAILGFYGFGPAAGSTEMVPIYKDFAFEGGSVTSPMLNCTIESATAAEFRARPLKGTFAELMKYTADLEATEAAGTEPSPEAIGAVIRYYADLFTAFDSSSTDFGGFNCEGTDPQGMAFTLSIGPSTVGGFKPNIYPSIALNDFRMEVADQGWMELGNFTFKPMYLGTIFETLLAVDPAELNQAWFEANWRKIIPALEGFSAAGLSMDVPDMDRPGARIVAGIDAFDVSLADYVNGIPATVSTSGSGIRVAVPQGADGAPLRALGIETLDLGFDIAARWNEDDKTISLDKLALTGAQLGGVSISGTIANAGPELFSEDPKVATLASTALTVTELTIDIENSGIVPTLIAAAAAEQQMPPEAFRLTLAGMAQALPLAVLGATPDALGLSQSLGAFLEGTPNLTINLKSTDPKGIGLPELMAAEKDPTVLKGKVAIVATASGEPVPFVWPEPAAVQPAPEAPPAETVLDALNGLSGPQGQPTEPEPAPASPREAEKNTSKN